MGAGHRVARLVVIALAIARVSAAQPLGSHAEFTPMAGRRFEKGTDTEPSNLYGGICLDLYGKRTFGFEVSAGMVPVDDRTHAAPLGFTHIAGNVVVTPWARRYGQLFGFLGAGESQRTGGSLFTAEFGGGALFWFNDALGLRLEGRGFGAASGTGNLIVVSVGLARAIGGGARDTDGDGVPDPRDHEPNTPRGAQVDAFGVARDDDRDHVPNGIDRDDHTPQGALVDQWGVAIDTDHDKVPDGLDQCPDTPVGAAADALGCPHDQDKDGVWDGLDKCADTPVGCSVDAAGCTEDADKDGVCDKLDQCADTPAGTHVNAQGCPVIEEHLSSGQIGEALTSKGTVTFHSIHFETGRSDILSESAGDLNEAGDALTRLPGVRIEVAGHCDIRGSDALNQALSEQRAQAVIDYLVRHFPSLSRDRFTAKGYGRSRPVSPNTTAEGMALNRRVEFTVLNAETLKR